jgi:type III pantothenate kinase
MLLAIDIGNARTSFGVFHQQKLIHSESLPTPRAEGILSQHEHPEHPRIHSRIKAAIIASVHPAANKVIEQWIHSTFNIQPLLIGRDLQVPVETLVVNPHEVGADRLLNALAAYHRTGGATVVVDFGTAITFDVIDPQGRFVGGIIAPGLSLMAKALHQHCTLLPLISPSFPENTSVGKNTTSAMQIGIATLCKEAIEGLLVRISRQLKTIPRVLATGGEVHLIAPHVALINQIIPSLTLEGLHLCYLKCQSRKREN